MGTVIPTVMGTQATAYLWAPPSRREDRTRTLHGRVRPANAGVRSSRQVDRGGTIYAASRPFPQLAERNYHTCPYPPPMITEDGSHPRQGRREGSPRRGRRPPAAALWPPGPSPLPRRAERRPREFGHPSGRVRRLVWGSPGSGGEDHGWYPAPHFEDGYSLTHPEAEGSQ